VKEDAERGLSVAATDGPIMAVVLRTAEPIPEALRTLECDGWNCDLWKSTYPANDPSEDRSTLVVNTEENFIFTGVWDGHGAAHLYLEAEVGLWPGPVSWPLNRNPPPFLTTPACPPCPLPCIGGTKASDFAEEHIWPNFEVALRECSGDLEEAFKRAYRQTDTDYIKLGRQLQDPSMLLTGTCAVGAYGQMTRDTPPFSRLHSTPARPMLRAVASCE
jgi:hypothetical protein